MKNAWDFFSYLGLKDSGKSHYTRENILANRINMAVFVILLALSIVTAVIRELNQVEFTMHTKKLLILSVVCFINFFLAYHQLFRIVKFNLIFTATIIIVLLPILTGNIQQMDFIYGPVIITSLSLVPQLILEPRIKNFFYSASLAFFLILVVTYDNLLVYFSPVELPIIQISHSFHAYYKIVFLAGFVFIHASLYYLRELAFRFETELRESNLILEQQKSEILEKNEELEQQQEEILAQSHELEAINRHLEERVIDELTKNRKKDVLLIQQGRQASMGEMIGNIAHQWRQPLSAVAVIVQNIQEAHLYNELTKEYLDDKIKQCMEIIDYMSHTIDDFRNFFKPEKSATSFNVKEAVSKCISFVKDTLSAHKIDIELHATEDILVKGFGNEYSQVVFNLINNARDVLLERKVKKPKIEITLFRKEDKSYLYVADNGGGIAPELRDKIFTPYFTTKSQGMGTGIGLYMSKTIIEKNMGGSLTFIDIEGGAEFCVVL